jgi:very-short-patch-repair endonuclease
VRLRAGGRGRIVDCLWRKARLIVELDGRVAHVRELAFEDDRARDRALTAAGWRPIRITRAQLRGDPDGLEADLRALLGLD